MKVKKKVGELPKEKLIILLDTSGCYISLAVIDNRKLLYWESKVAINKFADLLIGEVKRALSKIKRKIDEVNMIFYVDGIGNLTGLRSAAVFAATLKVLRPIIEIYSVDSRDLRRGLIEKKSLVAIRFSLDSYYLSVCYGKGSCTDARVIKRDELKKLVEINKRRYVIFQDDIEQDEKDKILKNFLFLVAEKRYKRVEM